MMNLCMRPKHFVLWALHVAAAIAPIGIGLHCNTTFAQAPQPSMEKEAEKQESLLEKRRQAKVFDNLASLIEARKAELQEQGASTNPQTSLARQQLDALLRLQKRFHALTQHGELNQQALSDLEVISNEIVRKHSDQSPELAQLQKLKSLLADHEEQLNEREKRLAIASQQIAEQRRVPLPPLENGTMKLYKLKFVPAHAAAQTVESLFGAQALRLAVDERGNTLIAYSKPESIAALDSLVSRLDEQAAAAADPDKSTKNNAALPRSLMVRVFWLADGVPQTFGQNPADFLPASVLAATAKLGLESPRLVVQTVSSLATGKEDTVEFSTSVPAALFEQAVVMNCGGKLKLVSDDRVRVDMNAHVVGDTTSCDLIGSMATPLGHYMVLGTANSRFAQGGMAAGAMPGGEMGMAGPAGPGGFQPGTTPRRGRTEAAPGGEFGGPAADPTTGMPGDPSGMPAQRSFTTSRFAFVVQVVEGKSYEAEKLGQPESK